MRLVLSPSGSRLLVWAVPVGMGIGVALLGAPAWVALAIAAVVTSGVLVAQPTTFLIERDPATHLPLRRGLARRLDSGAAAAPGGALVLLEIERFATLEERHDRAAIDRVLKVAAHRLEEGLRRGDVAARLDGAVFAVALSNRHRLDLESALQVAAHLQRSLGEPIPLGERLIHLDVSVGFALTGRVATPTGDGLLEAAGLALVQARKSGPNAIRSYSGAMVDRLRACHVLTDEARVALDRGEFTAHFQPQVDSMTGAVSGFEALARWQHPTRGLVPPSEFLPALEEAGLMAQLGTVMVQASLDALTRWAEAGFDVPRVAVNFSHAELCDPRLVDRLAWELHRQGLAPERLVVEVLETVVAVGAEDMVVRNLGALARLGCYLDLDDFGIGQTSITSIRRFAIARIKIDRSFVTGLDADPDQQRMVSAILTMAERLGLETLAEGVETEAERRTLTRLGVGHLQGYGIARPMAFADTLAWLGAQGLGGTRRPVRERDPGNVEQLRRA